MTLNDIVSALLGSTKPIVVRVGSDQYTVVVPMLSQSEASLSQEAAVYVPQRYVT